MHYLWPCKISFFRLVYVECLIKQHSNETRDCMKLTGGYNMNDESTHHQANCHVQLYKLEAAAEFKMLQKHLEILNKESN